MREIVKPKTDVVFKIMFTRKEGDLIMLKQTNVEAIKDGADVIFRLSDDKEIKDIARRREDALRTEKARSIMLRRGALKKDVLKF